MKKTIATLLTFTCFVFLSSNLLAQKDLDEPGIETTTKNNDSQYRLAVSWSVSFGAQPELSTRTSILGLGFVIFQNDRLHIRNKTEFCNGIMIREDIDVKTYTKTLAEKISVGILTRNNLFRPYGFLEGRIGTSGGDLYEIFDNPRIWSVGLGTGLDIFATASWSFSIELGFLGHIYQGKFFPMQRFEIGVMKHFLKIK